MKFALIENGIVLQIQPNKQDGFIEVDDSVICGMLVDGGVFTTPEPEPKSPYQAMSDLESTRTPRREREARMGVTGAQQWLDDLDLEIEALRPEL